MIIEEDIARLERLYHDHIKGMRTADRPLADVNIKSMRAFWEIERAIYNRCDSEKLHRAAEKLAKDILDELIIRGALDGDG